MKAFQFLLNISGSSFSIPNLFLPDWRFWPSRQVSLYLSLFRLDTTLTLKLSGSSLRSPVGSFWPIWNRRPMGSRCDPSSQEKILCSHLLLLISTWLIPQPHCYDSSLIFLFPFPWVNVSFSQNHFFFLKQVSLSYILSIIYPSFFPSQIYTFWEPKLCLSFCTLQHPFGYVVNESRTQWMNERNKDNIERSSFTIFVFFSR